jgi:hypothetical protein
VLQGKVYMEIGDSIGDMHGRSVEDLMSDGLDCLPYVAPWAESLEVRDGMQLGVGCLKDFIEARTGKLYMNKDLVIIGEDHQGIVAAYSYDGNHGGIIKLRDGRIDNAV